MSMKETAYINAVARIRFNELSLLSSADLEQLITAKDTKAALAVLRDKGWIDHEGRQDIDDSFKQQAEAAWELLMEIAPDTDELRFLVVGNDFHNIKAALKSFVAQEPEVRSFITPSIIPPQEIRDAIFNKDRKDLPDFARNAIEKTYNVLVRTLDGQLADIMLDAMALDCMAEFAARTRSSFVTDLVELISATANLKIALRAARTGKGEQFLTDALCNTKTISRNELIAATLKGEEELKAFISNSAYGGAVEQLQKSAAAFEKWCDDLIISHISSAKYKSFGIDPLVAYFFAKQAEIKSVRIIISCKQIKLPAEAIRERVREIYV